MAEEEAVSIPRKIISPQSREERRELNIICEKYLPDFLRTKAITFASFAPLR